MHCQRALLWFGLLCSSAAWAQSGSTPPALQPAPAPAPHEGEHHEEDEPPSVGDLQLRTGSPLGSLGDPKVSGWFGGSFQDSAFALRGAEREFARVGQQQAGSFTLGGVVPVEVMGSADVRARDRFGAIGGDDFNAAGAGAGFGLSGDFVSTSAQAVIRPTQRLRVAPRARVERSSFGGVLGDGVSDQLSTGQAGVDLTYQVGARLQLKVGVGRGAAQVQQAQLVGADPNAALNPALSQRIDIGGAYTGKYTFLGVNTFHTQLSNVIESLDGGEGRARQLGNAGDGFTSGMETEQRVSLGFLGRGMEGVSLWSNQTLLISRVDDGSGVERSIQGVPLFIANAGVRYQNKSGTSASATATYMGDRLGAGAVDPSQLLVDVAVRQRVSQQASLFVSLENLTDERQALSDFDLRSGVAGRDLLTGGRTVFTGLSWQLGAPPAAPKSAAPASAPTAPPAP